MNATLTTTFEDLPSTCEESNIKFLVRFQQRDLLNPEMIMAEYELILYAARNDELGREYRARSHRLIEQFAPVLQTAGADEPIETAKLVLRIFRAFEALRTRPELVVPALLGARPQ